MTLRVVTASRLRSGRGSILGPDTARRARWYDLTLSCGHLVQRRARYRPLPAADRPRQRSTSDVLPPPDRAVCDQCGADTARKETP